MLIQRHNKPVAQFAPMAEMLVAQGDLDDWQRFKALHYKAKDFFKNGSVIYRLDWNGQPVGVAVAVYSQLLMAERHKLFPSISPKASDTAAESRIRGSKITKVWFGTIARLVLDEKWRGVGIGYRFLNLVSRMHPRQVIEIKSTMALCNPFIKKAGFTTVQPIADERQRRSMEIINCFFSAKPDNPIAMLDELNNMPKATQNRVKTKLGALLHHYSSRARSGENAGVSQAEFIDKHSAEYILVELLALCFSPSLYGAYKNPDFGTPPPASLPLLAFDNQKTNEKLRLK